MSVLTVLVFFVYNNIVFEIANILLLDTTSSNLIVSIADKLANALLPFGIFARFMVVDRIVNSILVIILVSILSICVGLTVGMFGYKTAFQMLLADKNNSKVIETKTKKETPFKAFLMYEIKSLFRNSTYLFVYFVMSLSMPIMVMLCNGFILEFAVNKVGSTVIFGVTLFVIMCFVSIICSPTASFISKEGEQFWIIKTNPHGIKYPLIAKSVVGVVCAGCSLLATLLAVSIKQYVSIGYAAIIMAIALVFIVGLVALGINLNLLRPSLFKTNTENSSNMAIHVLASFVIATIIGVLGILGVFIYPFPIILLSIILIVVVFTIVNVSYLLLFSKKLYQQMEVK
jgi:ABC-2 type transport system permease protein